MHIAVTGATGLIGKALIARLLAHGHTVRALVRHPERLIGLRKGLEAAAFDALDTPAPGLLAGCKAVIHLAGTPIARRWTREQKERMWQTRVTGTTSISQAAAATGTVKVLISASAIGFYGPRGPERLSEDDRQGGSGFLAAMCRSWENATVPARAAGIRTTLVRIGVVLHPDGGALAKMVPLFKLGLGGRLGSGKQYVSWIHLDDLVSLLLFVLTTTFPLDGPVNATAPNPVTNAELTRALARVLHRPAFLPVPAFALKLALGEMATVVLDGQRIIPGRALTAGFNFAYPTVDEALAHLLGQGGQG